MMQTRLFKFFSGILIAFYISSLALPAAVLATPAQAGESQSQGTKHEPKRGTNPETGKVSFIGGGDPIHVPGVSDVKDMPAQARALGMANAYGKEFGLKNPSQELKLLKLEKDGNGKDVARYQQIYEGVPVMAGELIVNINGNGELLSIHGEVSSDLSLDTKSAIKPQDARRTALAEIAELHVIDEQDLTSTDPELWIFDESLLTVSTRPVELVWRMEVTAKDAMQPIRELVLVNAETGTLSWHINQLDSAADFNPANSAPAQQTALPLYFDLVMDEGRGWIYGSDSTGNKVDVIDIATSQLIKSFALVNGATPKGLDFDPATDELAVAQNGGGSVIFIDPDTGSTNTAIIGGKPFDVIYGRSGRLYSVGSGGTTDYIHVLDTLTHTEVTRSSYAIYSNPRLAISSDKNFLYTNMTYADVIYRFDVTTDTIQNPVSSSRFGLLADHFILAPDDSEFITDKGQVWSSDLKGQISMLGDWVGQPVYVPVHDVIAIAVDDFGSNDRLVFASATNFYTLSTYALPVQGTVGPIIVDSAASRAFVSTDHGLFTVDISVFPPGVPATLPSGSLPYADLVIDEAHGILYGSNLSGHKIDVISLSTLQVVDEIRFMNNTRPSGMDLKSDSQELAVALNGGSSIAFIDTNTRTITASVIVDTTSYNVPFDVKYGRPGRLYSTGNPGSSGTGDVYIYDTNSYLSIGKTNDLNVRTTPYLAVSPDNNSLFTVDTAGPNRLCRFDVSTDIIPAKTCGIMSTYNSDFSYILLRDGSKIFTGNGQVWLPSPWAQLGSFTFSGYPIEIPNRSVIAGVSKSSPGTIIFVRKSDFYTAATYTMPTPGAVGPGTSNADGSKLFLNTQTGIKVVNVELTDPVSLSLQAGSPQSTHVLAAFGTSLQAKVQNLQGEPLAGVQVTFTAPATGASGTFTNTNSNVTTAITDANGIAIASTLVANNLGGTYSVSATVANLPSALNFQLTNVAPSVSVSSGSPQSTQILTTFVDPLKAIVQFNPGEPIAGVEVTFTAPASGASGTFASTNTNVATAITDANGIAAAPAMTGNSVTGSYLVRATIPNYTSFADFQLTNLAGVDCNVINGSDPASLFLPYRQYNCGKDGYAVGVADFSNDNKNDVVLSVRTNSTGNPSSLLVFIQGDNGTLSQPRVYAGGNRAENMAVGDINNDGMADVVTADFADNKISVFIQRNTGGFATRVTYSSSSGPDAVAINDVNNDGLKDVVVAHHTSSMIGVFTQKPDGTLNAMTTYPSVSAGFDDIAIGDVNNDGLNDVVKMNGQGLNPNIMVYLQNASGTLTTSVNYSIAGCTSFCLGSGVAIGDITGDGRSDVALSYGGNGSTAHVAVFAQNTSGSLQASVSYPAYDIPGALDVADFNTDGLQDVVVVHEGWLHTGVFLQQNNGTLASETLYTIPNFYTDDLEAGDLNNDALPDVAIADGVGLVLLYRNTTMPSTVTPGPGPSPTPRATSTAGPSPTAVPPSSTGNRSMYTASNGDILPGTFLCDQSQINCTNGVDLDADNAHKYAADTFVFYNTHHHRNSFDDVGGTIVSTVNYGINYQNAAWTGSQMVYGDNMAADDVVGHELTHGVTQYTSGLIYSYQSGAINESFSDVWGEFIDQVNGSGNDALSVKWLMGEDTPLGAIRSMSNPPAYGDPDKMSSPYYYNGSGDNGGVHINSGVNNKAAYLMVEGGTFNGRNIIGIGLNKTAAVYYQAQVYHLTMGANYNDLYYALLQACQNLIGGSDGITQTDCDQVRLAAEAVEMIPTLPPTPTPTNSPTNTPTDTPTFTPTNTFTPTATPPYSYNPLYLSLTSSQTIGGVSSADEDILRFDGTSWSLFFDGSDVGVGSPDLFAFSVVDADTLLLAFSANVTVNGITATPQDVLRFEATSLGANTAGTFYMYLDGSDVGLDSSGESIDSVSLLADGRVLISTTSSPAVPGVSGKDEDVLAFSPTSLGDVTAGTWAMYLDGSDVGLADSSNEDIDALDVTADGKVYLSTLGDFAVAGVSGFDEDVFICVPTSIGNTTACNYLPTLYFDGSTWNLGANDVDAFNFLTVGPIPTPAPTNTPTNTPVPTHTYTPTYTSTVGPSLTFTFTPTTTFTATPTATFTATATASNTPLPTNTFTPTATFTPSPTPAASDLIFADGFESGSFSAWSANKTDSGDLSVSAASALVGSNGMQVVVDDTVGIYVTDDLPSAEPRYRARFYLDPNSLTMLDGQDFYLFTGYDTSSVFQVQLGFSTASGYRIRLRQTNDSAGTTSVTWVTITDAPHVIELEWQAASAAGANNGVATLWIDGVQSGTLSSLDNDTRRIEYVRLGAVSGLNAGTSGTYFIDAFESRRQTYIGP